MRLKTHSLLFAFAALTIACGPAPQGQIPAAGYDTTAPQLPDDPTKEGSDGAGSGDSANSGDFIVPNVTDNQASQLVAAYSYVDKANVIKDSLLSKALAYYDANKGRLKNSKYLAVLDFSLPSNKKRLHIINMSTGAVWSLHVAHGKGSDSNHDAYAEKFSNASGSNASSLGIYRTAETYSGSNGYSLRLDGLSSTNSRARSRAIVIHGASYVQDANVKQGRSWGCPAISMTNRTKLINMIKGGSIIFAGI